MHVTSHQAEVAVVTPTEEEVTSWQRLTVHRTERYVQLERSANTQNTKKPCVFFACKKRFNKKFTYLSTVYQKRKKREANCGIAAAI